MLSIKNQYSSRRIWSPNGEKYVWLAKTTPFLFSNQTGKVPGVTTAIAVVSKT